MNRTATDKFWDFSLEIYRFPGVADRLIALQDDYDADVNLVLFCCWCGQEGRLPLEATFFERADRNLGEWRREVIEVLRSLRREMKGGIRGISPETSEPIRGEVKRLELNAERVMQSALASVAPSVVGPGSPAYAREALEAYLHHCGIAVTGDVSKLVDLLAAGMSESD